MPTSMLSMADELSIVLAKSSGVLSLYKVNARLTLQAAKSIELTGSGLTPWLKYFFTFMIYEIVYILYDL